MAVTMISRALCQGARVGSVESLRVTSFEPSASVSIRAQVNTRVAFSLRNPCCQKISSSGLRRMGDLLCRTGRNLARWPRRPRHEPAGHDESKDAHEQPLPVALRREVEA